MQARSRDDAATGEDGRAGYGYMAEVNKPRQPNANGGNGCGETHRETAEVPGGFRLEREPTLTRLQLQHVFICLIQNAGA